MHVVSVPARPMDETVFDKEADAPMPQEVYKRQLHHRLPGARARAGRRLRGAGERVRLPGHFARPHHPADHGRLGAHGALARHAPLCIRDRGSVYFVACGGAAAYLAKCVASSETVAYDDLGTEALRRIEVVDFPVFVGVDVQGRDVYDLA